MVLLNLSAIHVPSMMVTTFLTLVGLICLDTVLGMVLAIVKGTWKWNQVGHFLETSVLPYVTGLLGLAFLALLQSSMLPVFYSSATAAALKFVADIVSKINNFGIQVPEPKTTTTTTTTIGPEPTTTTTGTTANSNLANSGNLTTVSTTPDTFTK